MTKVQVTFKFTRALSDLDLENISRVHAVYGILAARPSASLEEFFVEYDAARLTRKEVIGTMENHGLPVALQAS